MKGDISGRRKNLNLSDLSRGGKGLTVKSDVVNTCLNRSVYTTSVYNLGISQPVSVIRGKVKEIKYAVIMIAAKVMIKMPVPVPVQLKATVTVKVR